DEPAWQARCPDGGECLAGGGDARLHIGEGVVCAWLAGCRRFGSLGDGALPAFFEVFDDQALSPGEPALGPGDLGAGLLQCANLRLRLFFAGLVDGANRPAGLLMLLAHLVTNSSVLGTDFPAGVEELLFRRVVLGLGLGGDILASLLVGLFRGGA